MTTKIEGF